MAKTRQRKHKKPLAFGSRYLIDTETKYSISELELLAVVWGSKNSDCTYTERWYIYIPIIKHGTINQKKPKQQTTNNTSRDKQGG